MLEFTSVAPTGKTNDTCGRPEAKASDGTATPEASDESFETEYGASEQKTAKTPESQEESGGLENNPATAVNEAETARETLEKTQNSSKPSATKDETDDFSDDVTKPNNLQDAALDAIPSETDDHFALDEHSPVTSERKRDLPSKSDISERKETAVASVAVLNAQVSTSATAASAKVKSASKSATNPTENIISAKTRGANGGLPLQGQGISKPADTSVLPTEAGTPEEVKTLKQITRTVSQKEIEENETQFIAKEPKVPKPGSSYKEFSPAMPIRSQPASNLPSVPVSVIPVAKTSTALLDEQFDTNLSPDSEANLSLAGEPRTAGMATTGTLQQLLSKPGTPIMIGRQMAEALQKLPDRPVEVLLNPSELGHVRMSISAGEAGITVSVLTERPETMDLLRRNISDLEQEFKAIGYENINFSFSEGNSREAAGGDSTSHTRISVIDLEPEKEIAITPTSSAMVSGLDLRL